MIDQQSTLKHITKWIERDDAESESDIRVKSKQQERNEKKVHIIK